MSTTPAFPTQFHNDGDRNVTAPDGQLVPPGCSVNMPGATLRDYFAAKALAGLFSAEANPRFGTEAQPYGWCDDDRAAIANEAYRIADAMIAARSKA